MPGLDPGIHQSSKKSLAKKMDCGIKPGNDERTMRLKPGDDRVFGAGISIQTILTIANPVP
jgi:hypothetical protein